MWGTQGSLPSPLNYVHVRDKLRDALLRAKSTDLASPASVDAFIDSLPFHLGGTYGGNTSCVEIRNAAGDLLIIDAGSGLRALGHELVQQEFGRGEGVAHILMSHFHWDHIQGFPFFVPNYIKGNQVTVWGNAPCSLRSVFADQQREPYFPVGIDTMTASLEFASLSREMDFYEGRFKVHSIELDHPGSSYAYRVEADGASFVYASDAEYKRGDMKSLKPYVEFFKDADALLFDAQFSVVESIFEKRDWGHSAAPMGVEIATVAGVKKLVLFHHDPGSTDAVIAQTLRDAQDYAKHVPRHSELEVLSAYDGMVLDFGP